MNAKQVIEKLSELHPLTPIRISTYDDFSDHFEGDDWDVVEVTEEGFIEYGVEEN